MSKRSGFAIVAAVALSMISSLAQAAACTGVSLGTSATGDVTLGGFGSDQCVISTANPESGPNGTTSGFDSVFTGASWSLLSKITSSPIAASFGGVNFNITFGLASGSTTDGTWSITADKNVTMDLVFAMHAANRSGAFLFDDQSFVANTLTSGTWDINWLNNGGNVPDFSNLTLFARDAVITAVPEPGTYALMLAGLGAVGFLSRRRRQT